MIKGITLTSSMRSNLLSLKTIATQMSSTQNILSTGKKVNSAIDNANAYYQSRSLANRASDLNSLLDSMSQGIQTIKAACEGLAMATNLIDQAGVIATQAYETAEIPEKAWFEEKVGANGAVVTTAQELKDAIASGKETICVYGKIDYFENEAITLKDNQKLVGTEYFTGFRGAKERFSQLNMTAILSSASKATTEISDIDFNFVSAGAFIRNNGNMNINNISIKGNALNSLANSSFHSISNLGDNLTFNGKIDINVIAENIGYMMGLYNVTNGKLNIAEKVELNIISKDIQNSSIGYGITNYGNMYMAKNSVINIDQTHRKNSVGIFHNNNCFSQIESGAKINMKGVAYLFVGSSASVEMKKDVEISLQNDSINKSWTTKNDYTLNITGGWSKPIYNLNSISSFKQQDNVFSFDYIYKINKKDDDLTQQNKQYSDIMHQFDNMIIDSSYQGTNLLTGGVLEVTFNENHTHKLLITGNDMRSEKLGIKTKKWTTKEDVKASINELLLATKTMRSFQEELGNNLSIIQTRQNFTEALSDVLEVGADKLVLADMNEASAEYLMLQTRQQLAVNSLSLASQSAKSILSLF